jgi:hypothetical protein
VKVASYGDIERFCRADGWQQERSTSHVTWTRSLPAGELLRTSISHAADKQPSKGRFKAILRDQLKVSEPEFWEAVASGKPVARPGSPEAAPTPSLPAYLVAVLTSDLHLTPEQLTTLGHEEARRLVHEYWARGQSERSLADAADWGPAEDWDDAAR